jgi:hypothetical protein
MGKKAKDVPYITHAHPCLECVQHEVVCVGPELGTCVECKWTKWKCDKSREKGKAASDEKGKAPGESFTCLFAFLDLSTSATEVRAGKRQKDPLPVELSDSDDVEMESPITQGTYKALCARCRRPRALLSCPMPPGFTGSAPTRQDVQKLEASLQ